MFGSKNQIAKACSTVFATLCFTLPTLGQEDVESSQVQDTNGNSSSEVMPQEEQEKTHPPVVDKLEDITFSDRTIGYGLLAGAALSALMFLAYDRHRKKTTMAEPPIRTEPGVDETLSQYQSVVSLAVFDLSKEKLATFLGHMGIAKPDQQDKLAAAVMEMSCRGFDLSQIDSSSETSNIAGIPRASSETMAKFSPRIIQLTHQIDQLVDQSKALFAMTSVDNTPCVSCCTVTPQGSLDITIEYNVHQRGHSLTIMYGRLGNPEPRELSDYSQIFNALEESAPTNTLELEPIILNDKLLLVRTSKKSESEDFITLALSKTQ